jgi:hypothetical protein
MQGSGQQYFEEAVAVGLRISGRVECRPYRGAHYFLANPTM